jgi:predicted RNA-binding protein with PIN domain
VDLPELEHRHLRGALEFAVLVAAEAAKRRPRPPIPAGLDRFAKSPRLRAADLGPVRRILEADDSFRSMLGQVATEELVDPVGLLWLQRPEGWEQAVREQLAELATEAERADAAAALRRAEKRRDAAERIAARARTDLVAAEATVAALREELEAARRMAADLEDRLAAARAETVTARTEARHARDRELAAQDRADRAAAERDEAVERAERSASVRDEVLADRTAATVERAELAELAARARELAERLGRVLPVEGAGGDRAGAGESRPTRRALPLPGGVVGDSEAATEYLLRSGATVLVDGYNVSMRGWPGLELPDQRRALLDAVENTARRFGADLTVVFDGAGVIGASADQRRLVRVVFSPEGVIADDVIRAEVSRLPAGRAVVVVTDDQEIVDDVRAMGANHVPAARFLDVVRR